MENNEKTYTVIVQTTAHERMRDHYAFLARVSASAASRLLQELGTVIYSLAYMPQRHPSLRRAYLPSGNYHSVICAKRYRVVYIIVDNVVYVEDIEDTRQGEDKSQLYLL